MASLLSLVDLRETPLVLPTCHSGASGFLLRFHSPTATFKITIVFRVCFFYFLCPISLISLSLLCHFLRTTTAIARKKITRGKLSDRTQTYNYNSGPNRDKDSLRDRNKYINKASQKALVTYVTRPRIFVSH
jgi:hypothetical protein